MKRAAHTHRLQMPIGQMIEAAGWHMISLNVMRHAHAFNEYKSTLCVDVVVCTGLDLFIHGVHNLSRSNQTRNETMGGKIFIRDNKYAGYQPNSLEA